MTEVQQAQSRTTLPQHEELLRRMACVCNDLLVVSIFHRHMALFAGQRMSGPEVLALLRIGEGLLYGGTDPGSPSPSLARRHFEDYLEVLIDDEAAFAQAKAALEESEPATDERPTKALRED